jgi:simple sugar transport system permease protein
MDEVLIKQLAGIISGGAPLVLAAVGEALTERAGVVNLSLDGSLMLSALAGFVVGTATGSALIGALAAALVGMAVALLVAFAGIHLRLSQVAVGFVLTLLCRDLAIFWGAPYRSAQSLPVPFLPIPGLTDLPIVGPLLFTHDLFTYLSFGVVIAACAWMFFSKPGLALRAVGDRPAAAFARGVRVNRLRYAYSALGGALVGLGGAAYSFSVVGTWSETAVAGNGWIALAIVIFGGWNPARIMLGVYLVAGLRAVVSSAQASVSSQVVELLNAAPWLLMLLTLLLVSSPVLAERLGALLRARPPAALGTRFDPETR